jgi:hypothetical protein
VARQAREALAAVPADEKLPALLAAAIKGPERVRFYATSELARTGDERAFPVLLGLSLGGPSKRLRDAAREGAATIDRDRAIRYWVHRFEAHGGSANRAWFQAGSQLSFIQDYDVEVSATAFIADPITSITGEGAVLDARVRETARTGHVVTRQRIHSTLREVTGARTVPDRRGAWRRWLEERESAAEEEE